MRNLKITLFTIIFSTTGLFAIGGIGLQLGQSSFSVTESTDSDIPGVTLTNGSFDGAYVFGGYLYIDAIPFIDLEVDANLRGNKYDINFENDFGPMEPIKFGWASADVNIYYTKEKTYWFWHTFTGWS